MPFIHGNFNVAQSRRTAPALALSRGPVL